MSQRLVRYGITSLITCALLFSTPLHAHAQSANADVRASIREEILKDPRTASLSEQEIDGLVDALAEGVSAEGIVGVPFSAQPSSVPQIADADACADMPAFLCTINRTFGFDGSNDLVLIALVALSGLIAFLLYELKRHTRIYGHPPLR